MKDDKLKMYFMLFTDFWKFFKKYSDVKDTEEYWETVENESQRLRQKYGKTSFVSKVLAEIQLELERCKKEDERHGDNEKRHSGLSSD